MIIETLGLLDDKVLLQTAYPATATTVSSKSYDTKLAGDGSGPGAATSSLGNTAAMGNTSTATGSGGSGAGSGASASQGPNTLSPPSAAAGPIGGPLLHDIGRGRHVGILSQIVVANAAAGGTGIYLEVITATGAALTGSVKVLQRTPLEAPAQLVVGYRFPWGFLPRKISQQYLGIQGTKTATDFTGTAAITNALFVAQDDHADILGAEA